MTTLARTACCRCREQKLRCSRELPSCDRCLRLSAICEFPVPPDRKVLAAFRAQARKRIVEHNNLGPAPHPNLREAPVSITSNPSLQPSSNDTAADESTYANADIQLSLPVQTLLQDVYFTSMFNSSLVFHQPTFSRAFQEGRLPIHVLLAVYASATIFLPPTSVVARRNMNLLQPLGDLKVFGRQLAIRAGKEVLKDIDQPSFESVQTCEMLTLYWFSAGESLRNTMFSGIAYKAACTLGLDLQDEITSSNETNLASNTNSGWLDAEIARRCFWAVWFTQCINSDHRLVTTSNDDRIMNLPLPLSEAQLIQDVQQSPLTLSNVLNQASELPLKESTSPSIMTELMILVFNWAKIRDLIRATNRVSVRDWLADLFEIEGQLSAWSARLPESFIYSKRNLYHQLVVDQQPVYVFVHALYHQCRLVLHSSLVPHFSGLHLHKRLPSEATSLSAGIALRSAQAISELGADLLALDWDPGQVPSFVGYCLYVSASIQITLLRSRDTSLAGLAGSNLMSNLKLLKSMKSYWTNLERLWIRINVLYGAQMSRCRTSLGEGNQVTAEATGSQANLSDLDRLVTETRDTGQLSEALSDSVLDYTLRRLKPDAKVDSSAVQELEKRLYPKDVTQLLDEDSTFTRQNTAVPMMRFDGQSYSAGGDPVNSGSVRIPPTLGPWDRTGAPIPSLSSNGYDWWQLNLDSIQQPILPYEELFSLEFGV